MTAMIPLVYNRCFCGMPFSGLIYPQDYGIAVVCRGCGIVGNVVAVDDSGKRWIMTTQEESGLRRPIGGPPEPES